MNLWTSQTTFVMPIDAHEDFTYDSKCQARPVLMQKALAEGGTDCDSLQRSKRYANSEGTLVDRALAGA